MSARPPLRKLSATWLAVCQFLAGWVGVACGIGVFLLALYLLRGHPMYVLQRELSVEGLRLVLMCSVSVLSLGGLLAGIIVARHALNLQQR